MIWLTITLHVYLPDDLLERTHVHRLEHVPVLEQPFLGYVGLPQLHTKLQVTKHNGLQDGLGPVVRPLFVPEHLLEGVQSSSGLVQVHKLWKWWCKKLLISIFWLCKQQLFQSCSES